jgi:hypothetical protein
MVKFMTLMITTVFYEIKIKNLHLKKLRLMTVGQITATNFKKMLDLVYKATPIHVLEII